MSYYEEDLALTKKYVKQGKSMKRTGTLFIAIQVILGIIMFFWTKSFIGLLAGFALFTVGKWFIERNMEREYLVTKYIGKTVIDEYTTHGGIMGGIVRMAGMLVLLVVINAFVLDYVFPEDNFSIEYIYKLGLLWVILHSIIRDVSKIKTGEQILKETERPNQRDIFQRVQAISKDAEQNKEKKSTRLAVVIVCLTVVLLLVQSVVSWIQSPAIAKELDMYNEYQTYYEEHNGMSNHYAIPVLDANWFEDVAQQEDAVKYSRFKTKCDVEGAGIVSRNGVVQEITMKLAYTYNETYGWRLVKATNLDTSIVDGNNAVSTNISGSWYGVGKDKTVNVSNENELTIVLTSLTTSEVSGSITCVKGGNQLYTKTFSGTVEVSGEYFYISATYDQEDKFYPTISFTYDSIQDIICYVDISPDTKFARVAE
jgi:hypothetical protein